MAARESLSILDPIPLNQLHDVSHLPLKKRKLCSGSDDRASQPIVIRPTTESLSDDPFVLEPIAVIARSRLPFEWWDTPSPLSQIQPGTLFVATIPVLETGLSAEAALLVVRLVSDHGLYVVERVKDCIYALSKLARGVEEGDVRVVLKESAGASLGWPRPPFTAVEGDGRNHDGSDWWKMAQVEDPIPDHKTRIPSKRSRVEVVFGIDSDFDIPIKDVSPMDLVEARRGSLDRSLSCEAPVSTALPESQVSTGSLAPRDTDSGMVAQSPGEPFYELREQYLQALYISKASVAYFAKGPLPRCRAAFQTRENKVSELICFYREAILTTKKMDLKYRETLPSKLSDIMISVSDDDVGVIGGKKRKSKKPKKALGKNGLYTEEEGFIRRWWKGRSLGENAASMEMSRETELKKNVSDLRLRETQLQILLILETMALEVATGGEENNSPDDEAQLISGPTPPKPKTRRKKPQDLNVMLELHLDRLCIWYAVTSDDAAVTDTGNSFGSSNNPSGKKVESDAMRDFCTEVIIPFYASRLPERCKSITRKLGVSSGAVSPFSKSSSMKKTLRAKSNAANAEKPPSQKNPRRHTLQRVLTDEQAASQGRLQPSLSRSSTGPSQSGVKRESTNPLLPTITTTVRGGIQKAKRAENREVDLDAVARQHETKLKRVQVLSDQKKELDAAILALRKPNRELVAKDIAQDADRRLTTSGGSRKPKNPVRNPLGQGVQVMATPRGSRKKDVVTSFPTVPKGLVRSSSSKLPRGTSTSSSFFSSPFGSEVVPTSILRPASSFSSTMPSTDVGPIQETPSRRPAQPIGSFLEDTAPDVAESPSFPGGTGTGIGRNLFRVPRRPPARPTDRDMAPSTPVNARHVDVANVDVDADMDMGMDMHLDSSSLSHSLPPPPVFTLPTSTKPNPPRSIPSSSTVMETPSKPGPMSIIQNSDNRPKIGTATNMVPVTPEKSIYAHLGWDDDDDELAF